MLKGELDYRTLLDDAPEGIYIQTEDRFVYVNAACLRLLGATHEDELLSQPVSNRYAPEFQEVLQKRWRQIVDEHQAIAWTEETMRTLSGEALTVEAATIPIDYLGQTSAVVFLHDIRAIKTEHVRLKRLAQFHAALGQCNQAMAHSGTETVMFQAVCTNMVKFGGVSMAWIGLLDAASQQVLPVASFGEGLAVLGPITYPTAPSEPASLGPTVAAIRNNEAVWCQDFLPDVQGTAWAQQAQKLGWCASVSLPLVRREEVVGAINLYAKEVNLFDGEVRALTVELSRDINHAMNRLADQADLLLYRLHLEELVAQRSKELTLARDAANAASVAKSAFLANMSHEIRTPLNAIIGLNYLLRRDGATPRQIGRLDQVDSASRHLLAIINDILDISKIEANRMRLEELDFSLSSILDNVAAIFHEVAQAKGLSISVDNGAVPAWLRGDPMRLRQALMNYVGNAIKFTDHGQILLRASLQGEAGEEFAVRFEVQDTGIGIDPEKLGQLFNAFEQADESNTRKYGGTGLGLIITRRLAELMGGSVGVDSKLGEGSTFWFTAKLRHGVGAMPVLDTVGLNHIESRLRAAHQGQHILLVEDNLINLEVGVELLTGLGLVVDTARDGLEALEKAKSKSYDLVLMDMQMPRMDGLEATLAIRALPGWAAIPIVAMTANAFDEDRKACEAVGMTDFVAKPAKPAELFSVLLRCLPDATVTAATTDLGPFDVPLDAALYSPSIRQALSRLDIMPGLNLTYGLSMVRGNAKKYLSLLAYFLEVHSQDMTKLGLLLGQLEHGEASQLAHSLKGGAATLGLEYMAVIFGRMESFLRLLSGEAFQAPAFRADMESVNHEFTRLLAVMADIAVVEPASSAEPLDPGSLRTLLAELDALLVLGDAAVLTLFEAKAPQLRVSLGAPFEVLALQIKKFDFDGAHKSLQTLQKRA